MIYKLHEMVFDWDPKKNQRNIEKHGIAFEHAVDIFFEDHICAADERKEYGETRDIRIGNAATLNHTIIVVISTDRSGVVRIISARRANRKERQAYHSFIIKNSIA